MKSLPSKICIAFGVIALILALLSGVIAINGMTVSGRDASATFFRLCSTQNPQECTVFNWQELAGVGVGSLILAALLLVLGISKQRSRSGA